MEFEFFVLLKPKTEDGRPSACPESFSVVVPNETRDEIMQGVKRIAHDGKKPMMQIQLRYHWQDLIVVESRMEPIHFTEEPYAFPIRPKKQKGEETMHFAICRGLPSNYMHPFQQQGRKDFPLAVVPAKDIDELVTILGGKKMSSFENEHEIFLPRELFSEGGKYDCYNVSYEFGPIHLELGQREDGATLWAKEVSVLPTT